MGNELRTSFLKHTPIGKKTQAQPYTAAAHLRYASRQSATDYVEAVRMPLHYWAAQDFLNKREDAIRVNGRVCDKFTLVFPRGMAMEHAIVATRSYMENVSDGRAPFRFSLQNFTDQTENPHAHIIYIDADVRTGKRVFRTSDLNSTDRLKDAWESAANDVLEREGYTFRLDREAVKELKREKANENDAEPDAPTRQLPSEPDQAHAHAPVSDTSEDAVAENRVPDLAELDTEAADIAREAAEPVGPARISAGVPPVSVVAKVRGAYQLTNRLKTAQKDRFRLTTALEWQEVAEDRSRKATEFSQRLDTAEKQFERDHTYGYFNGKANLKGFKLPSWSILPDKLRGWESKARAEAVKAQEQVEELRIKQAVAERNAKEAERVSYEQQRETAELAAKVPGAEHYAWMSAEQQRGALKEMEALEDVISDSRAEKLEGISAEALYEAFVAQEITADEALAACEAMGFDGCAEQIRHVVAQQELEQDEVQEW